MRYPAHKCLNGHFLGKLG